jgi:NADH-quinone oxidoreductase subunit H
MAVYSVTLAGWASANKFSLLGSMRASAQMISYEIALGLSLVPIVLIYGSVDLYEIVGGQGALWSWGIFLAPVSFVLFLICMFAETNRAPFDLAEGESELVAGFHVEFGSTKFALFYLTEYINMFALSLLCSIFFFGGWQIPFISHAQLQEFLGSQNLAALCGLGVLMIKAAFFMWLYIWVRWTIPRFRYDQLMALGWKFMLPLGLANIMLTALVLTSRFS